MDFSKAYGFHHGFAFRREAFGGILYHYEGVRPDPRVTFVDHPFLMDLLERVEHRPLEAFIAEVCGHFSLPPEEEAALRRFFAMLIERGALVEFSPQSSPPAPLHVVERGVGPTEGMADMLGRQGESAHSRNVAGRTGAT
jgi:putative mycofactocin binding protein MftB